MLRYFTVKPLSRYAIVFDLDDTLYCEVDFVQSGFRAASAWLESTHGIGGLATQCLRLFSSGRRTLIFDEALACLGVSPDRAIVTSLVDIYRTHEPAIALAPDAERYLRGSCGKHAVITDGHAYTQAAKVTALKLSQWVEKVIYTDEWGPEFWKPHDRAFAEVEDWCSNHHQRLVYVADNPRKDFVTPNRRGWLTVQIQRPGRVHHVASPSKLHDAHGVIASLDDLHRCLDEIGLE